MNIKDAIRHMSPVSGVAPSCARIPMRRAAFGSAGPVFRPARNSSVRQGAREKIVILKGGTLVPLTRAFLICTLAAACVLASTPAFAFCSKPITPHCVEDGSLADSYVPEERCRRALQDHVEDLTSYRTCLTAEIEQVDEAVAQFQNLLDGDAEKSRNLPISPVAPGVQTTAEAAR
jgi:hypothetical protein